MCIIRSIQNFIRNGAYVFSAAARGEYKGMSPRVKMLCEELSNSSYGPAMDKNNLRNDRKKINHDVMVAFEKYKSHNKE